MSAIGVKADVSLALTPKYDEAQRMLKRLIEITSAPDHWIGRHPLLATAMVFPIIFAVATTMEGTSFGLRFTVGMAIWFFGMSSVIQTVGIVLRRSGATIPLAALYFSFALFFSGVGYLLGPQRLVIHAWTAVMLASALIVLAGFFSQNRDDG